MPGWESPCSESKTIRLQESGTRGRFVPVEVSQWRRLVELGRGTASTTRVEDCDV